MNPGGPPTLPSDPDDRLAYIALAQIPALGARRIAALLSCFGTARQVLAASREQLITVQGMTPGYVAAIHAPPFGNARALVTRAESLGQRLVVPVDQEYPQLLRSIPDPPVLLFVRGRLDAFARPGVAIVGSRIHSRYGAEVARTMATAAAGAGVPVISGMARGLDAVAHAAALDAGGTSVGVLGTGADIVYPIENSGLFDRMLSDGLLVTEHPPNEQVTRWAFPRRNRIISGLARALVVVEAAEGSGTLVTVSCALEQGREVLVVPGPISSPTSKGTNRLIRDGATPLLTVDDLLAVFGIPATPEPRPLPPRGDLSPDEARVLAGLSELPRSVDDVALAVGLPIGLLLSTLLGLELGGLVEQLPDGTYRRR